MADSTAKASSTAAGSTASGSTAVSDYLQRLQQTLTDKFFELMSVNEIENAIEILVSLRSLQTGVASDSDLKRDLKKVLLQNIYNINLNESDDVSQVSSMAIDEAMGLLCRLKYEEKSDLHVAKKRKKESLKIVPADFRCIFTNQILTDPVIIDSGETFERACITGWLQDEDKCPKTNAILSDKSLRRNILVDKLIGEWCQLNKYERKPEEKNIDGISSLFERILSSPTVVTIDQTEAAIDLCRQTTNFPNVRDLFVRKIPGSINRFLGLFYTLGDAVYTNNELQESLFTALFYISLVEENLSVLAANFLLIPVLIKSFYKGTIHTQRLSAEILLVLSGNDSYKHTLGNSGEFLAMITLISKGDIIATRAASWTVRNLWTISWNREREIAGRLIQELVSLIRQNPNVNALVDILALFSTDERVTAELEKQMFIRDLLKILRSQSSEKAVVILYEICNRNNATLGVVKAEETDHGTLTKLSQQGSPLAQAILQWLATIE